MACFLFYHRQQIPLWIHINKDMNQTTIWSKHAYKMTLTDFVTRESIIRFNVTEPHGCISTNTNTELLNTCLWTNIVYFCFWLIPCSFFAQICKSAANWNWLDEGAPCFPCVWWYPTLLLRAGRNVPVILSNATSALVSQASSSPTHCSRDYPGQRCSCALFSAER